jgi:hypothetical protein
MMGAISRGWTLTKQSWAATGQTPAAFDRQLVETAFDGRTRRA